MSTFSQQQREKLSSIWSLKRDKISMSKRIHSEEEELIRDEAENKKMKKKKRKRSKNPDSNLLDQNRSQELAIKSRSRLAFSRFRSMNEFLYTHSTRDAADFMDAESFESYHTAYSEIASKWPVRPIDYICGRMRKLFKGKGKGKVFADMGCGSMPLIAAAFPSATVHSFDLISSDPRITQADVSNLPLDDASCDCVVFSLSLMGSNIADQVQEGSRILKEGGLLIIAEVTSRFKDQEKKAKSSASSKSASKDSNVHDEEKDKEGKETQEEEEIEIDSLDTFVYKLSLLGLELKRRQSLEPNNYFLILEFTRKSEVLKASSVNNKNKKRKKNLPVIRLKSCQYKPR